MSKKKRMAPGPGVEVTHHDSVTPVKFYDIPLERISIVEWHPDEEGMLPAEHVHFLITLHEGAQIGLRFKSPDTLGFLIEELIAYRKNVWKDAEPINPDAELEETLDERS